MTYLSTALAQSRYAGTKAKAHKALGTERAAFKSPLFKSDLTSAELIGLDDRDQPWSRRRRQTIGYYVALKVWGLPEGAIWIPCYICGNLFDAWTMESDHVHPVGGSIPQNLLLSCKSCNRQRKNDTKVPNDAAVDMIASYAYGVGYACGGKGLLDYWNARDRRKSAKGISQDSTPHPTI